MEIQKERKIANIVIQTYSVFPHSSVVVASLVVQSLKNLPAMQEFSSVQSLSCVRLFVTP